MNTCIWSPGRDLNPRCGIAAYKAAAIGRYATWALYGSHDWNQTNIIVSIRYPWPIGQLTCELNFE